jgi:DNA modification methylase
MVEASLTETGAGRSIVADKDGRIIAGNKTLEAWAGMGGAVKVVETDGHELVVVQRTDLDLSDPKDKARKLAYYDNRAGQVGLEWDAEQLLADVNAGVDLAAMFKEDEIAELLASVKGGRGDADAEPQIDQAEELNKRWQVKPGDLWRIGEHRLLCGDSTKAADVARVMGGEKAAAVVTDPPYAIMGSSTGAKNDPSLIRPFFRMFWDAIHSTGAEDVYMCCDWRSFPTIAAECPQYDIKDVIVWDKGSGGLGNPYRRRHEFIVFARPAQSNLKMMGRRTGGRSITDDDVWNYPRDADKRHNAAKPVGMIARCIENSTDIGELVFEPCSGSGTTLVACENLGRKCRAIEISPAYCAVILERMAQAFPKLEIARDDAG